MKRSVTLILALLMVFAVFMAGCSNEEPEQTGDPGNEAGDQYAVKMSIQYAVQQGVPFMYAEDQGIFDKYGISHQDEIPWYSAGAPQLEAQPGGEWDIGLIGYTAAIRAATHFDMLNLGMCGFDTGDAIYCRKDSDIYKAGKGQVDGYPNIYGNAELWKDKKIIVTLGTTRDVCLQLVLGTMGLTYDDVEILNMDNESGYQAWKTGEGDLWVPASTFGAQELAADDNLAKVADIADVDMAMFNSIITTRSYAAAHEEEVVRFLAAFLEASIWCSDAANDQAKTEYYIQLMKDELGVDYSEAEAAACIRDR